MGTVLKYNWITDLVHVNTVFIVLCW